MITILFLLQCNCQTFTLIKVQSHSLVIINLSGNKSTFNFEFKYLFSGLECKLGVYLVSLLYYDLTLKMNVSMLYLSSQRILILHDTFHDLFV